MTSFTCPGCKAEIHETEKICPKCGARLSTCGAEPDQAVRLEQQKGRALNWAITLLVIAAGLLILFFHRLP